jgi:hypothetical protein
MTNRRNRIPGVAPDAERNIAALVTQLDDRLRVLERRSGRAGVVEQDTAAKVGEFLNIEAPAAGLTIVLPQPVPALRNARVTLNFRNANPVRIVSILGEVNGFPFVINDVTGTFDAVCDGLDGWNVQTGVSPEGNPAAALDAHYLVGLANASLPNAAVADDTVTVAFSYTPGGTAEWTLQALTGAVETTVGTLATRFRGIRTNSTLQTPRTFLHFIDTNTVTWVPADDSANDEWEMRAHARAGNIRDNGSLEDPQAFLNFVNQTYITFTLVQDVPNQEIEVRAGFLGSFYNENSVGSIQTPFISYNDSTMLDAELTDNTGTSGYVDITFELKPQSAARVIGRARGAGVGIPTALTPNQTAAVLRWDSQDDLNVAGLTTDATIAEDTTSLRFSNGGATGIIRSIAAPSEEGQLVFPEMTTGGGDEFIYVHEDTSQTAANRIRCPGDRPFRGTSAGPPHALFYWPRSNRWAVIGPVGGHHAAIVEIDEHFDWNSGSSVIEGATPTFINFTSSNHSWAAAADPNVGPAANYQTINNVAAHRGILRIATAEETDDAFSLFLGRDTDGTLNTTDDLYDSDNIQRFACWVRIPTATSVKVIVGFVEDAANTDGGTEFIGFVADTAGSTSTTNWVMRCRAASTNTDTDTGVAFSTAWHKLEWFRYDEYVIFYVNRVFAGIISTNVPNGGGTIALRVQTLTAAERTLDVDRVIVEVLEQSMD